MLPLYEDLVDPIEMKEEDHHPEPGRAVNE